MESVNFWDSDVWSFVLIIGVLGLAMALASFLRNNVRWIRRSLIPSSVLGGVMVLIVSTIIFYATGGQNGGKYLFELDCFNSNTTSGMTTLEILTYHCLGLGFVATALRPGGKKFTGKRAGEVFDSGLMTVSSYLLQAFVGIAITVLLAWCGSKLWNGAGILLPFGYGQGTGQAMNFGSIYGNAEQVWGFASVEEGRSFGLTIAALGFLSACIGGVIYLNIMRKKGRIRIKDHAPKTISHDDVISYNETPMSGSVDKMTIQLALVVAIYGLSYLLMELICTLFRLGESMRATIFGFNFLIGTFLAIAFKGAVAGLHRQNKIKKQFINKFLMNRIAGFLFDFMVVAGIAAIRIDAIRDFLGALLLLGVAGLVVTYFYVNFICKKLFPNYAHEQFLAFFGMLTGTASTGVILLRVLDDELVSPASDNLVYQNLPAILFGFPMMLLGTYIYTGGANAVYVTLILIAVFFVVLQIIMFRRTVFKKKGNPIASTEESPQ